MSVGNINVTQTGLMMENSSMLCTAAAVSLFVLSEEVGHTIRI